VTTDQTLKLLRIYESRNVTFIDDDGSWPIVWDRAKGAHVWDAQGKKYLDLTAAFGVASAGHANPRVVRAGQRQMARLLHAMGDVHPHALKAELARELSRITFERWTRTNSKARRAASSRGKTIFCNSGFEAVEAALKTAILATHKPGVIVFEGAYHGLGYGALNATHRDQFRFPFKTQLRQFGRFVSFPKTGAALRAANGPSLDSIQSQIRRLLRREEIGAILVEPIQVRGGINIPPAGFLPLLRRLCNDHRVLLILDEIYTGFGRTGKWFACEHSRVVPDLICLGKALTGGFPLSACVARAELMDTAWPSSSGEAIHTSTFLGHPVGCAMALAQIRELQARNLPQRSAALGKFLLWALSKIKFPGSSLRLSARGVGLLAALELVGSSQKPASKVALEALKRLLHHGYIFLPEGAHSNVISFTPPLTISKNNLKNAVTALAQALKEILEEGTDFQVGASKE
jgi:4-aminobutyrate aminotransferase-like enzyme